MKQIFSLAIAATTSQFADIDTDNTYTQRTITITTHLAGQVAVSDDVLPNAISIQ